MSDPAPSVPISTAEPVGDDVMSGRSTDCKMGEEEVGTMHINEDDMSVEDVEEGGREVIMTASTTQSCTCVAREETACHRQGPLKKPSSTEPGSTPPSTRTSSSAREEGSPHTQARQSGRFLSSQFSGLSGTTVPDSSVNMSGERETRPSPSRRLSMEEVKGCRDERLACSPGTPLAQPTSDTESATTSQEELVISKQGEQMDITRLSSLTRCAGYVVKRCTNICL